MLRTSPWEVGVTEFLLIVFGILGFLALWVAWVVNIVYCVRRGEFLLMVVGLFLVPVGMFFGVIVLLPSDGGRIGGDIDE